MEGGRCAPSPLLSCPRDPGSPSSPSSFSPLSLFFLSIHCFIHHQSLLDSSPSSSLITSYQVYTSPYRLYQHPQYPGVKRDSLVTTIQHHDGRTHPYRLRRRRSLDIPQGREDADQDQDQDRREREEAQACRLNGRWREEHQRPRSVPFSGRVSIKPLTLMSCREGPNPD